MGALKSYCLNPGEVADFEVAFIVKRAIEGQTSLLSLILKDDHTGCEFGEPIEIKVFVKEAAFKNSGRSTYREGAGKGKRLEYKEVEEAPHKDDIS